MSGQMVFVIIFGLVLGFFQLKNYLTEKERQEEQERMAKERQEQERKEREHKERQERERQEQVRKEQELKRKQQLFWVKRYRYVVENDDSAFFSAVSKKPYIGTNFYASSYQCPDCGGVLYKTVFPVGGEYRIETETGDIGLKRVFTCERCKKFLTALPGGKLSDGSFLEKTFTSDGSYQEMLSKMDTRGSRVGRPDA